MLVRFHYRTHTLCHRRGSAHVSFRSPDKFELVSWHSCLTFTVLLVIATVMGKTKKTASQRKLSNLVKGDLAGEKLKRLNERGRKREQNS